MPGVEGNASGKKFARGRDGAGHGGDLMTATIPLATAISQAAEAVREVVQDAYETSTHLRISGRAHWIDAGRPVPATKILSLAAYAGVIDYVPGDLTITVQSGTTLREIENTVTAEGQWFPLDPHGSEDGTIGATIATGSFGPLAHGFGRARDLVLGLEFVTGDARVVRGGGRVVKNVAGFDLVRLMTGSWGTLGVLTEVTLRLHSQRARPLTLALAVPDSAPALAQRIRSLSAAQINPLAVELLDSEVAGLVGLPCKPTILVELGGNEAAVNSQKNAIAALGGASEIFPEVWRRLRVADDLPAGPSTYPNPEPNIVLRISSLPGRVADIWHAARTALAPLPAARMHSSVGLGIVRCILPPSSGFEMVHSLTESCRGATIVCERMPRELWPLISPTVVGDRISQGIKRTFDPHGILNPCILGA
jgi:glycolate dehydrogenase FAD-binding subunit